MKIAQIILRNVNNFKDFAPSFYDQWSDTIPSSLLLIGPNGCGKTTILSVIANLWTIFGSFLEPQENMPESRKNTPDILLKSQLAAIKIHDFHAEFSHPIWICAGKKEQVTEFLECHKECHRIGRIIRQTSEIKIEYLAPGQSSIQLQKEENASQVALIESLREQFIKNRLGASATLSNMLFLESETRTLGKIQGFEEIVPEQEEFNWLAVYRHTGRRRGSIQNYLFTLKAVHPEKYMDIIQAVNAFFGEKQISGFDRNGKLMVTTRSGKTHPIESLSSGEKQIFLILAFIARELRAGGIVLIDEPDLHLHESLSLAFVHHLKQLAIQKNGQLIMASHFPDLWKRSSAIELVKLDSFEESHYE